jgi:Xaa-Pro aminopeptidase
MMSDAELVREKLDQAVGILEEKDVDLWLTFVRETSQVSDPCLPLVLGFGLTWTSALILSRTGERVAIVGRFDADNVERLGGYSTVIGYDQSIKEPLRDQLTRLNPRRVAVNFSLSDPAADGLTHGMYRLLCQLLDGTPFADRLVSAEEVIAALRGRKSSTEIERVESAVQAAEAIFRRVGDSIEPGLTEREIAQLFKDMASARGMGLAWGADHCPSVTAGPESAVGHAMPGDHVLQRGHLLQVDFGVRRNGFVSDLQRTWYLLDEGESEPPSEALAAWEAARKALEAGREALVPGARGWEVDEAARSTLTGAGYAEYMHAFGHHVGRTAHDGATVLGPQWERYGNSVERVVEAGNIFAIELGVAVPGYGYIGCEEDVLVTPGGAEYLCDSQRELWCI